MTRALAFIFAAAACTPPSPEPVAVPVVPPAPVATSAAVVVAPPPKQTCAVSNPAHAQSWTEDVLAKLPRSEPYEPRVKPGNQTALNTAAVPFAHYLNTIHNRVHPIFADGMLDVLEARGKTDPLNDNALATRIEMVLDESGSIETMGVVKTSGQPTFDAAALEALRCAAPFGPAPAATLSSDKKVYLHWEFHRDEVFACSTMHARPFLLRMP